MNIGFVFLFEKFLKYEIYQFRNQNFNILIGTRRKTFFMYTIH
jgi:hypothetical protein